MNQSKLTKKELVICRRKLKTLIKKSKTKKEMKRGKKKDCKRISIILNKKNIKKSHRKPDIDIYKELKKKGIILKNKKKKKLANDIYLLLKSNDLIIKRE